MAPVLKKMLRIIKLFLNIECVCFLVASKYTFAFNTAKDTKGLKGLKRLDFNNLRRSVDKVPF